MTTVSCGIDWLGQQTDSLLSNTAIEMHSENVAKHVAGFSDNRARLHYDWWENKKGGTQFSPEMIAMQQRVGLEELASRGLELDAPDEVLCSNLAAPSCWKGL